MQSSLRFSRVRILESLPPNEVQTGTVLGAYVSALETEFPVEVQQWSSPDELFALLREASNSARTAGQIPIIHLECHGTFDATGLVARNGEVVSWPEIAPLLAELNIATGFNLLVFVAACNGGYFLETMYLLASAPCYGLIAPTDEVDPADVMRGARDFYRVLLKDRDIVTAVRNLAMQKLEIGRWFAELAETWFRTTTLDYVRTYCTKKALRGRARTLYRRSLEEGRPRSIGAYVRDLENATKSDLVGKHFDAFFVVRQVPANAQRFTELREDVRLQVLNLLAQDAFKK
ncbi:MAG TPA: hypothetical protein VGM81_01770 [Burkholderiaceae bacterium]|jgi:hypothetical protein